MTASPGSATAASERRVCSTVAWASFLFFALLGHGHFTGSDEVGVFAMTRSLVERGRLDVPPLRHTEKGADGLRYSYFAPGQSVLAVPFYALGRVAEAILPEAWQEIMRGRQRVVGNHVYGGELVVSFTCLFSAVVAAALVSLFYRFERLLGASPRSALIASALLAATTQLAILSTFFLRHPTEALTTLGSLYFLMRWRDSGRVASLAIACALASATLLVRVPAGLIAPPLAGYIAWAVFVAEGRPRGRALARAVAAVAIPLAIALLLHGLVSQIKWGGLMASPMLGQQTRFDTPLGVGLVGLLLSPGSSVFLYSPILLLTPWTFPRFWRRHRAEALLILSLALLVLLVYAKFDGWSGLWSAPGPRYLFIVVPLLLLPLGPWLDRPGGRGRALAVGALAALGLWVQAVSTAIQWGAVPTLARYPFVDPDQSGMLFEPARSPVLVMSRLLFDGGPFDPWLLQLAVGWPGSDARPGLAIALLAAWGVAFGWAVHTLLRDTRRVA